MAIDNFITKEFKAIIQNRNIDLNYSVLRNTNYWFQIFSARFLEMHNIQGEREKTDLIFLDILIEKDIINSGFLLDFNYSPQKDELENIVLTNASKRLFKKETMEDGTLKSSNPTYISGDVFVTPAKQVVNINIYYVTLTGEIPESKPVSSESAEP